MPARTKPHYTVWMRSDLGTYLVELHPLRISCSRVANGVGGCMLTLPASFDADSWVRTDHMLEIWRTPVRGKQILFRTYFCRFWRYETDASGEETFILGGPCVNDILRRRVVAYAKGTSQAKKTAMEADDMMKEVVDETWSAPPTPTATGRG